MEGKTSQVATRTKDTRDKTLAPGLLGSRVMEEWTRASQEGRTRWEWGEEVLTAMGTPLTGKRWGGFRSTRVEEAGAERDTLKLGRLEQPEDRTSRTAR